MRKQLLDALKAKFEGVSEAILNRIADKLAKTITNEEDVTTAVEGVTLQQVLESYGDSRATEAQQSAVSNYEKKYGIKNGIKVEGEPKPEPEPPTEPKPKDDKTPGKSKNDDTTPDWAKGLIGTVTKLTERLNSIEGEKVVTTRKSTLSGILEKAPEKIRQRYEKDFARLNFKDDEDFNGWISEITPDIEALTANFTAKGAVVTQPKGKGGAGKEKINPILQERLNEESKAEPVVPAIIGLPQATNK